MTYTHKAMLMIPMLTLLALCIVYLYDLLMRIAHEQAERAMRSGDEYKYPRPLLRGENDE
jgi:hypothetical protein